MPASETESGTGGVYAVRLCVCVMLCVGAHSDGVRYYDVGVHTSNANCAGVLGCVCGVVWCGVVWCGVVWCGVVWCGVVWCGDVRRSLLL
jgi:hypothetical protein